MTVINPYIQFASIYLPTLTQ